MASIQRRRESKIWTAFFRDTDRRLHSRSTGTTDRKIAKRVAEEFEAAARKQRTLRQLQRVLDQMHELVSGERVIRLTLQEHVAQWLETKRPETAPATYVFYQASSAKLLGFLGSKTSEPLTTIAKADLLAFRSHLCHSGLRPATVNQHLAVGRMLFSAAIRDGVLTDDPSQFIDAVKAEYSSASVRRGFKLEELRAILGVADPEWRSLILFGLYSGQRLSDLAALRWANIDLTKGQLRLQTRKTGKVLILPMAPALQKHLESLPSADDLATPLHPRAFRIMEEQRGRTSSLSAQFYDLLVQSGLAQERSHQSKGVGRGGRRTQSQLSFHSLRHSTTTIMHESGVPEAVARSFIGHDTTEIHRQYVGVGWEALSKAAAALPEL